MTITDSPKFNELRAGAEKLRANPSSIDHATLAHLVADWIEAEILMWEVADDLVSLVNSVTAEVSGGRAGSVKFGINSEGEPTVTHDTSIHARRIVAAIEGEA